MDLHVKVLAAFYLIFGVLGILGSLMVLLIFGGAAGIISMAAPTDPDALLAVPVVGLLVPPFEVVPDPREVAEVFEVPKLGGEL